LLHPGLRGRAKEKLHPGLRGRAKEKLHPGLRGRAKEKPCNKRGLTPFLH